MATNLRVQGPMRHRTLLLTAAALPLAGWTVHALALHRRVAATRKDPLTGLLRRDTYTARARHILRRHGDTAAVIMVDQDHFKAINDGLGHAAGDAVLTATAARLIAWAGPSASIGRLGGDEFAIVLHLPRACREERLAQLVQMLHTPVVLDNGQAVDVAASIGAATPDVLGSRDLTQLQRAADAALYSGKHSGRAVLATAQHLAVRSVNGRRAGRPGTAASTGARPAHAPYDRDHGGGQLMNPTHLAVDGYVDAIPEPGNGSGTARFELIVTPGDADDAEPDVTETVFTCTTADPVIADALLTEIQPGDLLRVSGTVVQGEAPDAPTRLTVDVLEVLVAAPLLVPHDKFLERYGVYVVVIDADRDQVPVFTASGAWVGEAESPDRIGALIDSYEHGGSVR